ncbi:hypothetical protein FIBSPDRAFT_938702, partial [Athelia psychrophila]
MPPPKSSLRPKMTQSYRCREPHALGKARNPTPSSSHGQRPELKCIFQSVPQSLFPSGLICIPSTTSYTCRNALRSPRPHQRLRLRGSIFSRSVVMEKILILLNACQTHRVRLGSTPQRRRGPHKRICLPGAYQYPAICVWSQGVCRRPEFGAAKNHSAGAWRTIAMGYPATPPPRSNLPLIYGVFLIKTVWTLPSGRRL